MGQVLNFGREPKPINEHYFPKRREIHVMLCKGLNVKRCGIYRLMFNDHYYIGRSKDIRKRAKTHMVELQRAIQYDRSPAGYQIKMYQYLVNHPDFLIIKIEILEECPDSESNIKENEWLTKLGYDSKCLNINPYALRTSSDAQRSRLEEIKALQPFTGCPC